MRYSLEPSTTNMYKDMVFCHLRENLEISMEKRLMDTGTNTGLGAEKTAS